MVSMDWVLSIQLVGCSKVETVLVGEPGVGGGDDVLAGLEPVEHFDEIGFLRPSWTVAPLGAVAVGRSTTNTQLPPVSL